MVRGGDFQFTMRKNLLTVEYFTLESPVIDKRMKHK